MAGAARQVRLLESGLLPDVGERDAKRLDNLLLNIRRPDFRDRADGKLGIVRRPNLVGETKIERSAKEAGDFRRHGDPPARQREDQEIGIAAKMGESRREAASGVNAIAKGHDGVAAFAGPRAGRHSPRPLIRR